MTSYNALGVIAVTGAVVSLVSVVVLHLLPTGYNPVRNAISDYGVGPYRRWLHAEAFASGVAAFTIAIASTSSILAKPIGVTGLLVAAGTARILLAVFPTDVHEPSQTRISRIHSWTRTGRIHMVLAIISFAGIAFAAGFFNGTTIDTIVGRVVVATAIITLVGLVWWRLKPIFGLLERLFFFSMIGWFLVIGIELIRLPL